MNCPYHDGDAPWRGDTGHDKRAPPILSLAVALACAVKTRFNSGQPYGNLSVGRCQPFRRNH